MLCDRIEDEEEDEERHGDRRDAPIDKRQAIWTSDGHIERGPSHFSVESVVSGRVGHEPASNVGANIGSISDLSGGASIAIVASTSATRS